MPKKRFIRWTFLIILLAIIFYGIRYAYLSFPIISGYGAKNLCSCMFVSGRAEKNVKDQELGDFPLSIGNYKVNYNDSTVTGTVLGFASKKAIYRKGLGCTLINDLSERDVRNQHFMLPAVPTTNTDTIPWPMGDLVKQDSATTGVDLQQLQNVLENGLKEKDSNKLIGTRALLVIYDGKLVGEKYAAGYDRHSPILGWSMTKSVIGALTGILVKEGRLQTALPAPVPEWQRAGDPRHAITIEHLLQQTSGLDFEEVYTRASSATDMLFRSGDMAAFVAARQLKYPPGQVFSYSSGNTNLLSGIIRQTVGETAYHSFPATALFHKIGMNSAVIEPDASGTFVGSSFMYATARDWARFGLLYYNNGISNGERILPEDWVKRTTTPSVGDPQKQYGYQFWLNGFDKTHTKRLYPDAPADMYFCDGYGGQEVYIIPSKKLVIVRLGLHNFDENSLLKEIISTLPKPR